MAEPIPGSSYSTYPKDEAFKLANATEDAELAKKLQQELNEISSIPVSVYLLLDVKIDNLYGETKNARYGDPIKVTGHFSPMSLKFELNKWGLDSDLDFLIFFVQDELIGKCGRLLQQGDLLYDCYQRLWEVTEQHEDTNMNYIWINQYVLCKRKLGDTPVLGGTDYQQPAEGQNVASTEQLKEDKKDNFFSY